MSMFQQSNYPDFQFPFGMEAHEFTSVESESPWPIDSPVNLLDDSDTLSLSQLSSDDQGSVHPYTPPLESMDFLQDSSAPIMFDPKPENLFVYDSASQFPHGVFNFDSFHFEAQLAAPYKQEPILLPESKARFAVDPVPTDRQKSSRKSKKRPSSASDSIITLESADLADSSKAPSTKRVKRCKGKSSSKSLPHVDEALVSSLLAENELKKQRLARKAELARLGRKAKNDQIEALQRQVQEMTAKLQLTKARNAELLASASGSVVKVEPVVPPAIALRALLSALDASLSNPSVVMLRFFDWLVTQNYSFYSESNNRGLLASLASKHLELSAEQKHTFVSTLKSLCAGERATTSMDLIPVVQQAIKLLK